MAISAFEPRFYDELSMKPIKLKIEMKGNKKETSESGFCSTFVEPTYVVVELHV